MGNCIDEDNGTVYMSNCVDRICRPGGLEITLRAAQLCGWKKDEKILDLGCGSGVSLRFLEQKLGLLMQGLEIDKALCDGGKIIYGDAARLPWADSSLDGILTECSFSRMASPAQVLTECRRVLRPGGKLAISDMFSRGEEFDPAGESAAAGRIESGLTLGRLEHLETIEKRLTAAGFRILTGEDWTKALQELWGQAILDGRRDSVCQELGYEWNAIKRARCGYYLWICEPENHIISGSGGA